MKTQKIILFIALLTASVNMVGGTVGMQRAKALGLRFVEANFTQPVQLEWVYTAVTESGQSAFYAFNGTPDGFVLVSASDLTSPILGYSETGAFREEDLPDGLSYFLEGYRQSVDYAENNLDRAEEVIAQEWANLERVGRTKTAKTAVVPPLISTRWDQECYYNAYCPEHPDGWCGHAKTGCVATAMGQVMKYWNYPEQGTGSHSYNCYYYGQLSADFGATTYHWDEMPESIDDYNDAVATLLYHCGVSVSMGYGIPPGGSGASEMDMAAALRNYFGYGINHCLEKGDYSYDDWTTMMRDALNAGLPIPYAGSDAVQMVGHSFVCDGYDANGLFHFNWGWSGVLDGYFSIDNLQTYNLNWNTAQLMIPDVRPMPVYNATPKKPEAFAVVPLSDDSYLCSISWRNPSKTLNNSNLTSIDQIVVTRNGEVVYTEHDVTAGAAMQITDEVPCFGLYDYQVYAVNDSHFGETATQHAVRFGPSCTWSVDCSTSSMSWYGAKINLINNRGQVVGNVTSSSSSQTVAVPVPLGKVGFAWSQGNSSMTSVTFAIKDTDGQVVYAYSGATADLPDGVFLTVNNACGNALCDPPAELYATADGQDVTLSWLASGDGADYNVYRDGVVVKTVRGGAVGYVDEGVSQGGHCYAVTTFCEGGESEPTNEACASAGEGCWPASDLWYELTSNNKIKLTWEPPQPHEGLSAYYLYRTKESEMNWKQIKILSSNATSYTDNSNLEDETSYLYKLVAYYQSIDCHSAPARSKYNEFEYYLRVYWSVDAVGEDRDGGLEVFPVPGTDQLNLRTSMEGALIQVFDLLGVKRMETTMTGKTIMLNTEDWPAGVYVLKVCAEGEEAEARKWIKK